MMRGWFKGLEAPQWWEFFWNYTWWGLDTFTYPASQKWNYRRCWCRDDGKTFKSPRICLFPMRLLHRHLIVTPGTWEFYILFIFPLVHSSNWEKRNYWLKVFLILYCSLLLAVCVGKINTFTFCNYYRYAIRYDGNWLNSHWGKARSVSSPFLVLENKFINLILFFHFPK